MQHVINARTRHERISTLRECLNPSLKKFLQVRADNVEGQEEYPRHHSNERRNSRVLSRQDSVELLASDVLPALTRLHDTLRANLLDEREAHIRHRGVPVQPSLMLHLKDYVFEHLAFVLLKAELAHNELVILDNLACRET